MIGFALGDGTWLEHILEIFPHHTKDKKLLVISLKCWINTE